MSWQRKWCKVWLGDKRDAASLNVGISSIHVLDCGEAAVCISDMMLDSIVWTWIELIIHIMHANIPVGKFLVLLVPFVRSKWCQIQGSDPERTLGDFDNWAEALQPGSFNFYKLIRSSLEPYEHPELFNIATESVASHQKSTGTDSGHASDTWQRISFKLSG